MLAAKAPQAINRRPARGYHYSKTNAYAKGTIILGRLRREAKVKVTLKTVRNTMHPNIKPHIDFGIPTYNGKGGMLWTHAL